MKSSNHEEATAKGQKRLPDAENQVDYKSVALFLYKLLDDIDSADDFAKDNDALYRKRVEILHKRKSEVASSHDGLSVCFTNRKSWHNGRAHIPTTISAPPRERFLNTPAAWVLVTHPTTGKEYRYDGVFYEYEDELSDVNFLKKLQDLVRQAKNMYNGTAPVRVVIPTIVYSIMQQERYATGA